MTTARRTLWGAVAIVLITLGVAGARITGFLSGGGLQPTALIPADVAAAISIDLDPALDQKLAVRSIAKHFPSTKGSSDNKLRLQGLELLLPDCVDPDRDIGSWFGFRVAIAVPSETASTDSSAAVAVIQIRDTKVHAARAAAARIETCAAGRLHLAIRDHFMLLSTSTAVLTRMVALPRAESLNRSARYQSDLASLEGNQIATVWGDGPKVKVLLDSALKDLPGADIVTELLPSLKGRAIVGIHASKTVIEIQLATLDVGSLDVARQTVGAEAIASAPTRSMAALFVMPSVAPSVDHVIKSKVPGLLRGGNALTRLVGLPSISNTLNADGSRSISLGPTKDEEAGLRARALADVPGAPAFVLYVRPATIPGSPRQLDPIKAIGVVASRSGYATVRVVV